MAEDRSEGADLATDALASDRSDAALAQAELAAIYESEGALRALISPDMVLFRVTEALARLHGLPAAEHPGKSLRDVVPEIAEQLAPHLTEMRRRGDPIGPVELRHRLPDGSGREHTLEAMFAPVKAADGTLLAVSVTFRDMSERQAMRKALARNQARLEAALESVPLGIVEYDPQARVSVWDARASSFLGLDPAPTTLTLEEVIGFVPDDDRPALQRAIAKAEDPVTGGRFTTEHRVIWHDGTVRWIAIDGRYEFDGQGADAKPVFAVGIIADVTARKQQEQQRDVLVGELRHRVRNTLAIIQAMASQTVRASTDLASFGTAFTARLRAVAAAHDLISSSYFATEDVGSVAMRDLLTAQLSHLGAEDDGAFVFEGPDLKLDGTVANALGLIFHELATNAAKHGALSRNGGRVRIAWNPVSDPDTGHFRLTWHEENGPPISAPGKTGFGTTLIAGSVAQFDGAQIETDFAETGLRVTMILPRTGPVEPAGD